ncbi:DUF1622 domain-containing protein [Hymenobacter arizonensis]|nr:DUF1622 domain-containing protein [Hymenobacter arizonensis]
MHMLLFLSELSGLAPPAATIHGRVESGVMEAVLWLKLGIETLGATIIAVGVISAGWLMVKAFARRDAANFTAIRLTLARYLALALEFQLGADILSTAIAPSWEQIGQLGAIAVIRTALNYFLSREMKVEQEELSPEKQVVDRADS